MASIVIVEHHNGWPAQFSELARSIAQVMPIGSTIHHIGSTAVPNLDAKDVIDIQLGVPSLTSFDPRVGEQIGFEYVDRIGEDHCPAGLQMPAQALAKRFLRSVGRPANLHVRELGRFNYRYSLLCRDYLRAHPRCAEAYRLIKVRLAAHSPDDVDFYYDIKDPIFDIIMEAANEWAGIVGWSIPATDYVG